MSNKKDPDPALFGEIFTVTQLNTLAAGCLEVNFPKIWVSGEISNLSMPASGHVYFTLKDETAQVRCALFKFSKYNCRIIPKDGLQVLLQAKVTLYPGRGDFQLIVQGMEALGEGALQRQFDALKRKLENAGLFDSAHKKPLPPTIHTVGIITSTTGAAIADMVRIFAERAPMLRVIVYPTLVQGNLAPASIVRAIQIANTRNEVDVLIIGRGGGSIEDLWAFNEEIVAHAIFNSRLVTISAVGHETDITISDFVADHRAPTPTAAAVLVSADKKNLFKNLQDLQKNLTRSIETKIQNAILTVEHLRARLVHPNARIESHTQTIAYLQQRLHAAIHRQLTAAEQKQLQLIGKLESLSPLKTLSRGYCMATDSNQKVISSSRNTAQKFTLRFADGSWEAIRVDTSK